MNKKVYVITGATSGIGREITKSFTENGTVFASYRSEEAKNSLPEGVIPFYIDMTDSESIEKAAEFILSQTEKIDTLINAAGCVVAGAVEEIGVDRIRKQFEVNAFSHLDFTQKLLPVLKGGKVINISSMASFGVFPLVAPYCASKRTLDILFNSLQVEYGKDIKIVSVKPGVIATPLWDKSIKENAELENECGKYEKEYRFLMSNAKKNASKGLDVMKVRDLIIKIDNSKNPHASYTIGFDAKIAEIFSKLPQDWINFIVAKGLKHRIGV